MFSALYLLRGAMLMFLVLLLACAIAVAIAEGMSFGDSMYFVLITATTVGYGDIVPTTMWGRVASLAAGVLGLLVFGLIVAINTRAVREMVRDRDREHNTKG
jgi:voltage-gated potassium channel